MDDIEERMLTIVRHEFGVDESRVTLNTRFIEDLNADSLDALELIMEVEDEFDLAIPDEEAPQIATVGDAIDYIKRRLA